MRRLAWDGIAFKVPVNWELARYDYLKGGLIFLSIEDETSVRLEIEWLIPRSESQAHRFLEKTKKALDKTMAHADRQTEIEDLPPGWWATHCEFSEVLAVQRRNRRLGVVQHALVSGIGLPDNRSLCCAIRLNFLPGDPEEPLQLCRDIIGSITYRSAGAIQWAAFDIAFELDAAFVLEGTTFNIGSKLMIFRRDGRRLYLWLLSCADRFFDEADDESRWVIGFLNAQRRVPGIVFAPSVNGGISWRRRGLIALCHRDELARRCFRYSIGFQRDHAINQVRIWVYNYRHAPDIDWIRPLREGK